ncbi:recombination protein RecT [Paenibacillus sp. UNCCL117]|uniref:RecT family recombinase n=1 Tax=unclassified Paenibacillus TaxID=185978 RepID=UPI00088BA2DE|nr:MULTISPECIES: RecT family recombinase [unclassified Paenibacillus]SDD28473.1 recombination protein RecT [Paenibacillus sp. cl123]SFW40907.1 recombination protein RecT [Paenibacillus sp. UNCCL117]
MSANKSLQTVNTQALVGNFTQTELDTLKATIARGTTNEQFALFVQTCVSAGLNPFLNQVFCIVYDGKNGPVMSIQIAVEGIVAIAKKHPEYKGFIASEVRENDHFKANVAKGEVEHEPNMMSPGKTVGAYCIAYRDGMPNILVIVRSDQVEHLVKGRNGQMWKDYFDDMIVKHAIKRAFKRQFGIEVAEDEYIGSGGGDTLQQYEPQRRDITAEAEKIAPEQLPQSSQQQKADGPTPAPHDQQQPDPKIKQARAQMSAKFKELGITDKDSMSAYIAQHGKLKGDTPTLAEYNALLKIMDLHIQESKAAADARPDDDDLLDDELFDAIK